MADSKGKGHVMAGRLVDLLDPIEDFNFRHFRMRHMAAELLRPGLSPGCEAPDFELLSIDAHKLRLSDLLGQPWPGRYSRRSPCVQRRCRTELASPSSPAWSVRARRSALACGAVGVMPADAKDALGQSPLSAKRRQAKGTRTSSCGGGAADREGADMVCRTIGEPRR